MARAGFTLLETLVALAVLALLAALVTTRVATAFEQMGAHVAFQDLQTRATALRLQAFRIEAPQALDLTAGVELRPGWTARSDAVLEAGANGACRSAAVELRHGARVRARLAPVDAACRFTRLS